MQINETFIEYIVILCGNRGVLSFLLCADELNPVSQVMVHIYCTVYRL